MRELLTFNPVPAIKIQEVLRARAGLATKDKDKDKGKSETRKVCEESAIRPALPRVSSISNIHRGHVFCVSMIPARASIIRLHLSGSGSRESTKKVPPSFSSIPFSPSHLDADQKMTDATQANTPKVYSFVECFCTIFRAVRWESRILTPVR
jgi:hypothetical protein